MVLLFLATLLLTNRYLWLPADAPWVDFAAGDSYSYLSIANAFPSFPSDLTMPQHHSQRFFFPYLLGGVARALGVPAHTVFLPFAVLVIVTVVTLFHLSLDRLGLTPGPKTILLGLLILNPYTFRYHLAFPWMVSDLGFQLGLSVVLLGLLRQSATLTLGGLLVAALSKQTAILALPGVLAWVWWQWTGRRRVVRAAYGACAIALGLAIYHGSAWLVHDFSSPSSPAGHARAFFKWASTQFSLPVLVSFTARGVLGFVFPSTLLLALAVGRSLPAGWYRNRTFLLFLFLAGPMFLQPFVGGPVITDLNMTRLSMLAYQPALLALGSLLAATSLPAPVERRLVFVTAFCLAVSSFHHFYSFLGELQFGRAGRFAVVYWGAALLLFAGALVSQRLGRSERA
jgi:hypothetical protein